MARKESKGYQFPTIPQDEDFHDIEQSLPEDANSMPPMMSEECISPAKARYGDERGLNVNASNQQQAARANAVLNPSTLSPASTTAHELICSSSGCTKCTKEDKAADSDSDASPAASFVTAPEFLPQVEGDIATVTATAEAAEVADIPETVINGAEDVPLASTRYERIIQVGADYEPSTWEASEAAADPMTMSITLRQTGPGPFTVTRTYVSPTHCSTLKIEGDFSFSCQI